MISPALETQYEVQPGPARIPFTEATLTTVPRRSIRCGSASCVTRPRSASPPPPRPVNQSAAVASRPRNRRSRYRHSVSQLHYGPARVPDRDDPERAIELLQGLGYSACEIDFEAKFWMDYPWAERFGELARDNKIVLSVHAPIAGFMGHAERGKKLNMAVGMLDHSAGIAKMAGAELVVFHPGFLLERTRDVALDSICEQLGELRERLEGKDRAVSFGVEVMGRVREIGSLDDVLEISRRCGWVRPVIDFAHMHATSDGAYTDASLFSDALEAADEVLEPKAP